MEDIRAKTYNSDAVKQRVSVRVARADFRINGYLEGAPFTEDLQPIARTAYINEMKKLRGALWGE